MKRVALKAFVFYFLYLMAYYIIKRIFGEDKEIPQMIEYLVYTLPAIWISYRIMIKKNF